MSTTRPLLGALAAAGLAAAGVAVASAQSDTDAQLAHGQEVYDQWCAPCHAAGPGHPGTQSLQVKYDGDLPAVLLERTDLDEATVKTFVRQGVLMMAPFRKTEIDDGQLDALAAYVAQNFEGP